MPADETPTPPHGTPAPDPTGIWAPAPRGAFDAYQPPTASNPPASVPRYSPQQSLPDPAPTTRYDQSVWTTGESLTIGTSSYDADHYAQPSAPFPQQTYPAGPPTETAPTYPPNPPTSSPTYSAGPPTGPQAYPTGPSTGPRSYPHDSFWTGPQPVVPAAPAAPSQTPAQSEQQSPFSQPTYPSYPVIRPTGAGSRTRMIAVIVGVTAVVIIGAAVVAVTVFGRPGQHNANTASPPAVTTTQNQPTQQNQESVGGDSGSATQQSQNQSSDQSQNQSTENTAPATTTPDLSGYHQVGGANGIVVEVPNGWTISQGSVATNTEADNPSVPGQLIRFGASEQASGSLLSGVQQDADNLSAASSADYQQIQLGSVSFGSAQEAVIWEFTFSKNGTPTHGEGLYWRLNGYDYVIYVSSDSADWTSTQQVFQTAEQTASPTS